MAQQLVYDYRTADLSSPDRELCDYAVKLTLRPGAVTRSDVVALQNAGFTDAQITIAAQVIGYFNYINRIADGLGVEPQDWMKLDESEWRLRKGCDYGTA